MSAFRDYLRAQGQQPDDLLNDYEKDESWFVFNLILFRQGFIGEAGHLLVETFLDRFSAEEDFDPMNLLLRSKNKSVDDAVFFVSSFLCLFIAKPPGYQKEITQMKEYFVPGFASDRNRRQQLAAMIRPAFVEMPLVPRGNTWPLNSLDQLIKPDWLLATAGDVPPWEQYR